ncbi:MAG: hypothetical protein U9Q07_04280 [Planctomycetota bacterium]|nr:hypothetical protein [Planctomycetota bacterium]
MGGIGGGNPIPTAIGGGSSDYEDAYNALKSVVGEPNAGDDTSIDGAWRWARACGMVAADCIRRAMAQIFPDRATSFIPVFEEILLLTTGTAELTDEERRQLILERWTTTISGTGPAIEDQLQVIDPLFTVIATDKDTSKTTESGRGFEDWNPADPAASGPAFGGGRSSTLYHNYSWDFVVLVQYVLASGVMSAEQQRRMEQAKDALYYALPSHVTWQVFTSVGFILDESLLDVGAFGP